MDNKNKYDIYVALIRTLCFSLFAILCLLTPGIEGHCENISIVIDPGHGGDAMGGNYEDRIERDINLITAQSMKERLEKYEGVDVYITRDNNTDKEMSRKQRFEFAKSVNADFLISVHYNMSENHTLYGSEVWVASKGINYVKGYSYAYLEMESFKELGLFDRGIKNKLDKNKTGEYYGILKYAEDYGIPSVIVEHCHLDEDRDSAFWNEDSYIKFGVIDADNMAKFFNLSSLELGIDNSTYENITVSEPDHRLDVDSTEPEECNIDLIDENSDSFKAIITARDSDTYIQYYQISTDGGNSFSRLLPWSDRNSDTEQIELDKETRELDVVVRVFNQYEYATVSNVIHVDKKPEEVIEDEEADNKMEEPEVVEISIDKKIEENSFETSPVVVLLVTMAVLFVTFNIVFVVVLLLSKKKRKRKRTRVKVQKDDFDWDL